MGTLGRYFDEGFAIGGITVEVTVGCNGLVTDVWLANSGGMPGPVTSCVAQTVSYASFPAHALPNGAVFQYPITYRF